MSKKIVKTYKLDYSNFDIPKSSELKIDHICIGMMDNKSSFINQGNTKTMSYKTYDFGYGVHNISSYNIRISLTIKDLGKDEYDTKKYYAWKDIEPGEKTRVWANFNYKNAQSFNNLIISEINLGKTPNNKNSSATWSNWSKPNENIGKILNVKSIKTNNLTTSTKVLLIIFLILISSCFLPYIFYFFKAILK